MSDRTRNILYLVGGCVGILVSGVTAGLLVFYLFNGYITIPEATRNNFWALVNTLITVVLIPWLIRAMHEHKAQSQQNSEKLDETQRKVEALDETIKNGGGERMGKIAGETAGPIAGEIAAHIIREEVLKPRDPSSRDRSSDQEESH